MMCLLLVTCHSGKELHLSKGTMADWFEIAHGTA